MTRPPLRALLVGIDHYPGDDALTLHGAVHDAEAMAAYLRERLGVPAERVRCLLSPRPGHAVAENGPRPDHLTLLAELDRLCGEARPGEQVLIHFSGHGTRLRTAFPELKGGPRGHDEALVPCDAADPAAPLVLDVHLAAVLERLAQRGAVTTLILDCCHSGGLVRQARIGGVRCAEGLVDGVRPLAEGPLPRAELAAAWQHRCAARRRAGTAGSATRAGCRRRAATSCWPPARRRSGRTSSGSRREGTTAVKEQRYHGALTHFLLAALAAPHPDLTWEGLAARLRGAVHAEYHDQRPCAEGEIGRRVLGGELPRPLASIDVVEVTAGGRVRLGAGRAHGITVGARLAVFAPLADDPRDEAQRLGVVEVSELVGATESWAEVIAAAGRRPRRGLGDGEDDGGADGFGGGAVGCGGGGGAAAGRGAGAPPARHPRRADDGRHGARDRLARAVCGRARDAALGAAPRVVAQHHRRRRRPAALERWRRAGRSPRAGGRLRRLHGVRR